MLVYSRYQISASPAAFLLALIVLHPTPARPQSSDSPAVLREARRAQRDFERARRAHLPFAWDGGSGQCDVRIGRFCYWYHPSPERPPETESVSRARAELLAKLEAAALKLPGDGWILGQRVRYLVEQQRANRAVLLAQSCGGTSWWCDALEGFARHGGGDYAGADSAFARALSQMPEQQRCAWNDLSLLLEDTRRYEKLSCVERRVRGERIWWLADPLHSLAGNDLRTEHYSRRTMVHLLEDAENTYGLIWGRDMRQLLIRFGWPTHWSRSLRRAGSLDPSSVVGHEASPAFWFIPQPVVTDPWSDVTEVRWYPTIERPPARYAPPYAAAFVPVTGVQFARFRRGDSTVTVAAFDLTADSGFVSGPVDVRVAVARDPATPPEVGRLWPTEPRGFVAVKSAWRPAVLSLEVMKGDSGPVGRQRVLVTPEPAGLEPPLSDILLLAPRAELPRSLDQAAAAALRPAVVQRSRRVGLYWEMYQVPDMAERLDFAVTVTKARFKGSPYPVGRAECPARVASLVSVRWQEEPGARRGVARSIAVDLRRLRRGRYLVAIQVSQGGRPWGCSSREVEIGG